MQQWQCKSDYIKKKLLGFSCFGSSPTLQAAADQAKNGAKMESRAEQSGEGQTQLFGGKQW